MAAGCEPPVSINTTEGYGQNRGSSRMDDVSSLRNESKINYVLGRFLSTVAGVILESLMLLKGRDANGNEVVSDDEKSYQSSNDNFVLI